ncbi:flavodoxin [uncultured Anaerococcus sp.]|uniref:flavodoxin n=1 Tax=uncultured Anaerococcus sp. TaxID=293428 RepID=UPI0025D76756|nr:flavodoxin [uncultured Anaerococcus sp.]
MKKVAIIYWSGTGNTLAMAYEIADELKNNSIDVNILTASEFTKDDIDSYDGFAFGCPAMGSEELEESEFEPMFESVENSLSDKAVLIFGSYEWADGEWMRSWQERCENDGINLVRDGLIAYDYPDDEALEECRKAALDLAKALN